MKLWQKLLKWSSVLPCAIYILEPDLWHQPDMSYRNYVLLQDCLCGINQDLTSIGKKLIIKVGDVVDVLEDLYNRHPVEALWSH